jgi:hypothetical protein
MPKLNVKRRRTQKKSQRRLKQTRRNHRKQCGGGLREELLTKVNTIHEFLGSMAAQEHYILVHPNFPRKNMEDKYVVVFKDAELEDDSAAQKLLVIKMEKQGAQFVNVSAEYLQDGVPQDFIDTYPIQLDGANADSITISSALGSAFPEAGLAY